MRADSQFPLIQFLKTASSPPAYLGDNSQHIPDEYESFEDPPNAIKTARRTALWFFGMPMIAACDDVLRSRTAGEAGGSRGLRARSTRLYSTGSCCLFRAPAPAEKDLCCAVRIRRADRAGHQDGPERNVGPPVIVVISRVVLPTREVSWPQSSASAIRGIKFPALSPLMSCAMRGAPR